MREMKPPEVGLTARAVVKRVVDGDTLDVELRLPCRVRLLDCWAAEDDTRKGQKATKQLSLMAPEGAAVIVQIPTTEAHNVKDVFTFGRVLGRIWRSGDEESLSSLMVRSGHATEAKP